MTAKRAAGQLAARIVSGHKMSGMLPCWNDGAAKSAILGFVARVTKEGGPDYVRPAERIATFDNDGTLWCEQPFQVQVFFSSLAEALDKAGEYGITVVSMKRDWGAVFR